MDRPKPPEAMEHAGREIERRFLIDPVDLPAIIEHQERALHIEQGYGRDEGGNYRLRKTEDVATGNITYYKTRKHNIKGAGRLERIEEEIEITREVFYAQWDDTEADRITKVRFEIPWQGRTIELDIFTSIPGLAIAEIEFKSAAEATDPELVFPDWFGAELTERKGWSNRKLAKKGPPDEWFDLYNA